jgi:hypothetical protein
MVHQLAKACSGQMQFALAEDSLVLGAVLPVG